jgi:hypothetical protein
MTLHLNRTEKLRSGNFTLQFKTRSSYFSLGLRLDPHELQKLASKSQIPISWIIKAEMRGCLDLYNF